MTDFRVGDKVRAVETVGRLRAGEVYTVFKAGDEFVYVTIGDVVSGGWSPDRFELIEPEALAEWERELLYGDELKVGDWVRVTIEGPYRGDHAPTVGTFTADQRDFEYQSDDEDTVTVEKIDPPVVTFKPGDVVRSKFTPQWVYAITNDGGYTEVDTGNHYRSGGDTFSSLEYEKIELAAVPF